MTTYTKIESNYSEKEPLSVVRPALCNPQCDDHLSPSHRSQDIFQNVKLQ